MSCILICTPLSPDLCIKHGFNLRISKYIFFYHQVNEGKKADPKISLQQSCTETLRSSSLQTMGNLTRAGFRRKLSIANGYLETVNKLDSESPTLLLGNCERQIITVLLAGSVRLPSRHCSLRDPVKSGHPQRKRGYWGRACCPRPAMFQITAVDSPPSGQGPPGPPPLRATALNP